MNVTFILNKGPIVLLLLLCFVISLNLVEAGRSIRLRKVKTRVAHVAPRHISLSARSGNGMYARKYAYGRPIAGYSTKGQAGSNRRFYVGRRRSGKRENLYASRYRNWSPNAMKNPRADKIGHLKNRKELLPFLTEPPYGSNKHKRRVRPHRPSAMQRPKPPKKPNDFDDEYFFPEEAKRAETKYEYENRYPRPKKKRRPEFESHFKTPDSLPKIPYYDERPLPYKTKSREPSFSYSSFIQHPSTASDEQDDFYEDPDGIYSQPVVRNKKKKLKKKSNSRKKNNQHFKPFAFQNDHPIESYPPYVSPDDYDLPTKTYNKRNKPTHDSVTSSSDDEFLPNKSYPKPILQGNNLFSTDSDYRGSQNTHHFHFNPPYSSHTWSHPTTVDTTPRPLHYQTENGFQPHHYVPTHYNYNKDHSALQNTKTPTTNTQSTYYSHPDNNYNTVPHNINYPSHNQISTHSQSPPNYRTHSTNYNHPSPSSPSSSPSSPSPTYSHPLSSTSTLLTDVTIQKSVPIYDNTETFYNFNNNAYVNSHSSKYYNSDSDTTHKYATRFSAPSSAASSRNKLGEKTDSDSDFIKKHQNLYNNGLSGVPVQGDGYAKETLKKDYDIGYGDFQFDENPTT